MVFGCSQYGFNLFDQIALVTCMMYGSRGGEFDGRGRYRGESVKACSYRGNSLVKTLLL